MTSVHTVTRYQNGPRRVPHLLADQHLHTRWGYQRPLWWQQKHTMKKKCKVLSLWYECISSKDMVYIIHCVGKPLALSCLMKNSDLDKRRSILQDRCLSVYSKFFILWMGKYWVGIILATLWLDLFRWNLKTQVQILEKWVWESTAGIFHAYASVCRLDLW